MARPPPTARSFHAVGAALNGAPHLSLSRLVCPRLLTPNTDYLACVVPAFDLGRKAGLGQADADSGPDGARTRLAPAWTLTATAPTQVQLPVYYSWTFRTGEGGDFASLARRLKINIPAGLGQRIVAIGRPGFAVPGLDAKTTVKVEGGCCRSGTMAPRSSGPIRTRRPSSSPSRTSSISPASAR